MILFTVCTLMFLALSQPGLNGSTLLLTVSLIFCTWAYAIRWQVLMWRGRVAQLPGASRGWIVTHSVLLVLSLHPLDANLILIDPLDADGNMWPYNPSTLLWILFTTLSLHYIHLMKPIPPRTTTPTPPEARGATRD